MEYIISEEDLKELIYISARNSDNPKRGMDENISDFLKSKQPVEFVAEEKINVTRFGGEHYTSIDGKLVDYLFDDKDKNNIKIYIQKLKEDK